MDIYLTASWLRNYPLLNTSPSENSSEILRRQKVYLRSKTTTENTIKLSLFMTRSFIIFFFLNAQTRLTCSVVTQKIRTSTIPYHPSPDEFGNQLKACSCAWSRTSPRSLVFPTLALLKAILLQAGKSRS